MTEKIEYAGTQAVRQKDSVAVLTCGTCLTQRYADQAFMDALNASNGKKIVSCANCKVRVFIDLIPEDAPTALIVEDLANIFILVKDVEGKRVHISATEATNEQFNAYAESCMPIHGNNGIWLPEERVDFLDVLRRSENHIV
jgi:hypothetical protein